MNITVLIPTYRRPNDLARCLDALQKQTLPADEVLLVVRDTDAEPRGWKLIYDPMVAVDHYPAKRFDEDGRYQFNEIALVNLAHNETLVLLEYLPPLRRAVFLLWAVAIGTRTNLGFLQWLRLLPSEGSLAGQKLLASLRGRWQGWWTWQESRFGKATRSLLKDGDAECSIDRQL